MDEHKTLSVKPPTTFEEQIEILRKRNLIIDDEAAAIQVLKRINYYRLSAYMLSVKEHDVFQDGITFNHVYRLYQFDKKLRQLLVGILESVEVAFRTHISYFFAHKYGPLGYLQSENFFNEMYHRSFLDKIQKELSRENEIFISHYRNKYDGKFPVWVISEIMSFGTLSQMFSNLILDDRKQISRQYYKVPYVFVQSWLRYFAYLRNVCAHYGRLYNKHLIERPRMDDKEKHLFSNDRLFAGIFTLKKVCQSKSEWTSFFSGLVALLDEYEDVVDLNLIGFPPNWKILI